MTQGLEKELVSLVQLVKDGAIKGAEMAQLHFPELCSQILAERSLAYGLTFGVFILLGVAGLGIAYICMHYDKKLLAIDLKDKNPPEFWAIRRIYGRYQNSRWGLPWGICAITVSLGLWAASCIALFFLLRVRIAPMLVILEALKSML